MTTDISTPAFPAPRARKDRPVEAPPAAPSVLSTMRRPFIFGSIIILVFFGIFGGWAATAPLSSGAIASGIVSPDSDRKVIQHLEGGIIKSVAVKEGQTVHRGDLLVSLEPTQAQASYSAREEKWLRLLVSRARAEAEAKGTDTMSLPDEVTSANSQSLRDFIAGQQQLLDAHMKGEQQQEKIYQQQIQQLESQVTAIQADDTGKAIQKQLLEEELASKQKLVDQQLLARSVVLELKRQRAELDSAIASNAANTARARQSIEEVRLSIVQAQEKYRGQAMDEVSQVSNDLAQVEEEMTASGDVLRRTEITSPVDGTVLNLRNQTTGGVIRAGEPIMDIIPSGEEMVVVAKLSPKDIDSVHVGLRAHVALVPFSTRNNLPLNGEVTEVAADTTTDEATHQNFYEIRVRVSLAELASHHGVYMSPGMPANVTVVTGERTMLQYLVDPLIQSIRDAFTAS